MLKTKRLVREGINKLELSTARQVRTVFYVVYLQHGDTMLEFVSTLNGLRQLLASQGPA